MKNIKEKLFCQSDETFLITRMLFLAVFLTVFGSSFLFGYSIGILNNLEDEVKCFLMPILCTNASASDQNKGSLLYGLLTSSYIFLGTAGAFGSGWISNKLGRKTALVANNVIALVGGSIILLTYFIGSKATLVIGRVILGINAGITTGVAPTFIAEITPTPIRGSLTTCHQLFITIGIAAAYAFTLKHTFNNQYWIFALAIPIVPALLSIIILPFCPESPRYLYLNKHDEEGAKKAFSAYNHFQDADFLIEEIKTETQKNSLEPEFRILDLFTSPYRLALIISIVLSVMQQFSGINAVIGYSTAMFSTSRVDKNDIEYWVLLIGVINFLSTIPAVILMELCGRKKLLQYSGFIVVSALSACFLFIGVLPIIMPSLVIKWSYISIVSLCIYVIGFAIGFGPVPGVIIAELFTQAPRAAAYSISIGINWTSSFVILLLYPIIQRIMPDGFSFLIFIACTVPAMVFLLIYMPETKNRKFAEIAKDLSGSKVETNV